MEKVTQLARVTCPPGSVTFRAGVKYPFPPLMIHIYSYPGNMATFVSRSRTDRFEHYRATSEITTRERISRKYETSVSTSSATFP